MLINYIFFYDMHMIFKDPVLVDIVSMFEFLYLLLIFVKYDVIFDPCSINYG